MAGLSTRSPGLKSIGISVLLLVILLQVLLLHFPGVFIHSEKVLIGPVIFCENNQHGELICSQTGWSDHSGQKMYSIEAMLALCFYVPIVLVAFALLCMLLATYARDRTTLRCSMVCQAASALLTLGGIITFLIKFVFTAVPMRCLDKLFCKRIRMKM
uniref:Uncharacterized protein n=1 Tax=Poecilia reticulata TaxID=8081 RepID=A0A3P9PIX1_POERE